ncbi:MAG TPA: hypothetical protein VF805_06155 [Anaeromyxobacteraceae bacterium]
MARGRHFNPEREPASSAERDLDLDLDRDRDRDPDPDPDHDHGSVRPERSLAVRRGGVEGPRPRTRLKSFGLDLDGSRDFAISSSLLAQLLAQ